MTIAEFNSQKKNRPQLIKAWLLLSRNQLYGFFREPAVAVFNLIVPLFILFIQAVAFGKTMIGEALPAYRVVDVLPVTAGIMFVMIIGIFGMGVGLASMIESRTIAQYRLRPGGMSFVLSAYGLVLLIVAMLALTTAILILHLVWSTLAPYSLAVYIILAAIGFIFFLSLGSLIGSISGTPRAAQGLASALFFPLLFLSDALVPIEAFPKSLQTIANLLPGVHLYKLLAFGWIVNNDSFPIASLIYIIIFTLVFFIITVGILNHREQL